MTSVTNKYSDTGISPRVNVYAERKMLSHAEATIVLGKMGMPVRMPKNKSQTIKFRRPVPFTAKTIPLAEGVTPDSDVFDYEDVTGVLQQYGQVVEISDVIEDTHEDPVLNDIAQQSGENIGRTTEAVAYGVLKAGTSVYYANGSVRTDVNTEISINRQRAVVRFLRAQKGKPITKMLKPSMEYETRAVEPAYVCVAHTDCEADIRSMPGFKHVAEYGQYKPICMEELGMVENVRYVISADLSPIVTAGSATTNGMVATGGNVDVYPYLFFAQEAFAHVAIRGLGAVSPSIIPPNKITKDDPLGQRGVCGWKTWYNCTRLNENWMCRLEAGVTDLAA